MRGCACAIELTDLATTRTNEIMTEITIKDIKTGETLGTVERDEILDIGDKVRMPDGGDKFVLREELQLGVKGGERQTVYVGDLGRTPRHIAIDLGSCDGWTLQKSDSTGLTFARCISDSEADAISESAAFCRQHATHATYRLLQSSYRLWQQAYAVAVRAEPWTFDTKHDLQAAFVGWILVWKLVLDQTAHELSSHFGRDSAQLATFRAACRSAYDGSQAYRLTETIRNLVQHREIPPITLSRAKKLDEATQQPVIAVTCSFPVAWLLDDPKCKGKMRAEFEGASDTTFELPALIEEAMQAMNGVLVEAINAWVPELNRCILRLRELFKETAPAAPVLLRPKRPLAGSIVRGLDLQVQQLSDLANLVLNAPIPKSS
jgi:hypothetical protein